MWDSYQRGAEAAFEKFAARRGMKEIHKSLAAGDTTRAQRLATTPGVLNANNRQGTLVTLPGRKSPFFTPGQEAISATVVTPHSPTGLAVRKVGNPSGAAYSPEMFNRKGVVKSRYTPQVVARTTTRAGVPVQLHEYTPGQQVTPQMLREDWRLGEKFRRTQGHVRQEARRQGYLATDLSPDNAIRTPRGGVKFVDPMYHRQDETLPMRRYVDNRELSQRMGQDAEKLLPIDGATQARLYTDWRTRPGAPHMTSLPDMPAGMSFRERPDLAHTILQRGSVPPRMQRMLEDYQAQRPAPAPAPTFPADGDFL